MKDKFSARWFAQGAAVLVCVFALKQYYSTASADQLQWILMPTTACVALLSGESFEFESHSGYISADHRFLIASSCSGVNFLLTAFLMLSVRRLLFGATKTANWSFIPISLLAAYVVTLVANTTRILIALKMQGMSAIGWLDSGQLHRLEGIFIYFLFLTLLFLVSERNSSDGPFSLIRRCFLPLLVYYAMMLGIPFLNGAYRSGRNFWEYSIVVLLVPMVVLCFACFAVLCVFARTRLPNSVGLQSTVRAKTQRTAKHAKEEMKEFVTTCEENIPSY